MKNLIILVTIILYNSSFGQNVKTYSGQITDEGLNQIGKAVYTYYEDLDTRDYIKHGLFKYSFIGTGSQQGMTRTVSGKFVKGLKDGIWIFTTTYKDAGNNSAGYFTGTETLIANYKNGKANGNWKTTISIQNRFYYYGKWTPFKLLKLTTVNANFRQGTMVGAFKANIEDTYGKRSEVGNLDSNGYFIGTWKKTMVNGTVFENTFKDKMLYEFIERSSSGQVNRRELNKELYDSWITAKKTFKDNFELSYLFSTESSCLRMTNVDSPGIEELFSTELSLYSNVGGGDLSFGDRYNSEAEFGCWIDLKKK